MPNACVSLTLIKRWIEENTIQYDQSTQTVLTEVAPYLLQGGGTPILRVLAFLRCSMLLLVESGLPL